MGDHGILWTESDFDSMSWHDSEVYSIRLNNPETDSDVYELVLDIDYILEWKREGDDAFRFVVAPALLRFRRVTQLHCHFHLTYKEHLTIEHVERYVCHEHSRAEHGVSCFEWRVHLRPDVSPPGIVWFHASGFTQELTELTDKPIETSCQSLGRK